MEHRRITWHPALIDPRTALITGASSGIGAAFAEVFAAHGFDLVITARREDRLRAVAARLEQRHAWPPRARHRRATCSQRDAPARLCDEIASRGLTIDALVNNAGYGVPGTYIASPWERHEAMLQVMVTAVAELTHRLLPGMIERGYGRIINVASLAGLVPAPAGHTLYAASKAFLIKFSEALSHEGQAARRARHRRVSRLHAQRVPRRHRHARAGQQASVVDVDGRADRRAPGFRGGDGRDADLHQRPRQPRDRALVRHLPQPVVRAVGTASWDDRIERRSTSPS